MKLRNLVFGGQRDARFQRPLPPSIEEILRSAETRARALGHDHFGLSHLVLALLGGAGPTVEAGLRRKDIDVDRIVERIELALGQGPDGLTSESRWPPGTVPITTRTKAIVELVAGLDRSPGRLPHLLLLIILATGLPPADILREEGLTLGKFDE